MKLHDTTYKAFHEMHIKVENMKNPQILGSSKVGARGQITIPKRAREEFLIQTGDVLLFVKEGDKLVIKKEV
jgi:AbrB family looped-hinge helix DNA binding protein